MKRFAVHAMGAACLALATCAGAQAAAPIAPSPADLPMPVPEKPPHYAAQPCCSLCPRAADPHAYDGSKFLGDFRVLIEGRDGWLFRTGLDLTTRFDISAASVAQLRRLSDALRARGTQLVMVYQPPRGLMDPDELTPAQRRSYDWEAARRNYAAALQRLRGAGVIVPPLDQLAVPDKGYDYYFRRDHHWTAAGAQHTARVVADAIRKLPGYAALPRKQFATHTDGTLGKPGTLQKVAEQLCGGAWSAQFEPIYVTEAAGGGGSLLGNSTQPQVALIGTSNSDTLGGYDFNGYLEQFLGTDVLDTAITGGSFEGSLLHYLASKAFQQDPPKFLIWETPYQDYPAADQDPFKIYRQAVPLVNDGCRGKPALLSNKVNLHEGNNQLLFNAVGRILPLNGRNDLIAFQFSDPGVKDLAAEIWYFNGRKESLKLHFKQYVDNAGRFVAELGQKPEYTSADVMAVTMDLARAPAKPLGVTATICARSTPARRSSASLAKNP